MRLLYTASPESNKSFQNWGLSLCFDRACQRVSHYALFCKSQAIAAMIEFKILTSISGNSSQKLHCGNVVNVLWCQEFLSWWVLSGTISGMSRLLALISDINESHRLTWDLNGCQDSGALNSANNSPYLYQRNKIYGLINNQVEPFNLVSALCYHSSNNWWGCKDPNKHCYWPLRRIWGAECITIIINTRCFRYRYRVSWNPVFWACLCQCPLPRIGRIEKRGDSISCKSNNSLLNALMYGKEKYINVIRPCWRDPGKTIQYRIIWTVQEMPTYQHFRKQGGQLIWVRKIRSVMRKIKVHCACMSLSLWML